MTCTWWLSGSLAWGKLRQGQLLCCLEQHTPRRSFNPELRADIGVQLCQRMALMACLSASTQMPALALYHISPQAQAVPAKQLLLQLYTGSAVPK
jgi:hypothetical protein